VAGQRSAGHHRQAAGHLVPHLSLRHHVSGDSQL
jgi:hypothetical protein